jgi:hypothetical protein
MKNPINILANGIAREVQRVAIGAAAIGGIAYAVGIFASKFIFTCVLVAFPFVVGLLGHNGLIPIDATIAGLLLWAVLVCYIVGWIAEETRR